MANVLVTGTSRGIGLELVKQLIELPSSKVKKVFAVTRNSKSEELNRIIEGSNGRGFNIIIEDITNEESTQKGVEAVTAALNGEGLDILVNNVGKTLISPDGISTLSSKDLLDVLNTNIVSTQVISSGFLPLLRKGTQKKIANISTSLGSFGLRHRYSWAPAYAYKISKAGMNMLTVQWALDLDKENFTVFAVSPGWLKTDMGSQNADLDVSVGVASVKERLFEADRSANGKFFSIRVPGYEVPTETQKSVYTGAEILW